MSSPGQKLYEKDFPFPFDRNYYSICLCILHIDEKGLPGKKALSFK
jgi:hypothetical protein